MRIANPLYDTAFKYLMENNALAKKIVSLILEEDIEELVLQNNDHAFIDEKRQLRFVRVDFKAVIRQPDGIRKKVLIELQKSKSHAEALRFRRYLGLNYTIAETEKDALGNDTKVPYPIITIYILGYKVDDLPYIAVNTGTKVLNSITKEPLALDCTFINLLTHRMHVLQAARLGEERRTRLEHFLNLFSPQWSTAEGYILDVQDIDPDIQEIADYLSSPLLNKEFLEQLFAEEEIEIKFSENERKLENAIALAEQERERAEQERAEKEQERAEKEAALAKISNAVLNLHAKGVKDLEIAAIMDIALEQVKAILADANK